MIELQQIVDQKIKAMTEDGTMAKRIEDGIESAINSAIESQFQRYGDITKQLENAISDGLRIKTDDIPFECYNQQMLVAVKQKLGNLFASEASSKFMAEMDKLLAPAPKEMTIVELVNTIAATWKDNGDDELDEYATVELEEKDGCLRDTFSLKMWKQKETGSRWSMTSSRTADADIFLSDSKDGSHAIRINHKMGYNPTCFEEHEALIFKLYSAGTRITGCSDFDEDDCDLQLKDSEYY